MRPGPRYWECLSVHGMDVSHFVSGDRNDHPRVKCQIFDRKASLIIGVWTLTYLRVYQLFELLSMPGAQPRARGAE